MKTNRATVPEQSIRALPPPPIRSVLLIYFVLGAYAVCAQAVLLRETQVLLFGSELSWGLVLALWLAGVAVGSQIGGRILGGDRRAWIALILSVIAMPVVMTADLLFLRGARHLLGSGPGEYITLPGMLLVTAVAAVPVSVWVGLAFPAASALLGRGQEETVGRARSIGRVYLVESAGSLMGGALFSFLLVTRFDAVTLMLGGGAVLVAATALLAYREAGTLLTPIAVVVTSLLMAAAVAGGLAYRLDAGSTEWRWRSFAPGVELRESADSKYQNIAIGELANQFTLYTNGTVAATWPDHASLAVDAHLIACQHPSPARILLLGGGSEGLLKEFLRHRPEQVDYVTLDRRLFDAMLPLLAEEDSTALSSGPVQVHHIDTRRFVKRMAREEGPPYDLIVLAAPEPATTLLARLYTEEFFSELKEITGEQGVVVFSLTGSAGHWGPEISSYVGSVVGALERVFPGVMITFGDPVTIFATGAGGALADSGEFLAGRYRARGIVSPYFDPLWFEGGSDMLDPVKRGSVSRALEDQAPRLLNTDARPAASLYYLQMWMATSGVAQRGGTAPAEIRAGLLSTLLRVRFGWVAAGLVVITLLVGLSALRKGKGGIRRNALLWSVGTTGFAGMAIEIVLLYTFQVLYGFVYGMVGLIIGVFMFGLVVGSHLMNRYLRSHPGGGPGLRGVAVLDLSIMLFAAALVPILMVLRGSAVDWPVLVFVYLLVALSGMLGGLMFPLAASVRLGQGTETARAAGAVSASDHLGGCLGALVTGVALVPILGTGGACFAIALMKGLSGLLSGAAARP